MQQDEAHLKRVLGESLDRTATDLVLLYLLHFHTLDLSLDENVFAELCQPLEPVAKGRQGGVVVKDGVPIFRTTTAYHKAPSCFRPVHERIVAEMRRQFPVPLGFNNAMVELYSDECRGMKWHTDQVQDAAPDSWIATFSCFPPGSRAKRHLEIRHKESSEVLSLELAHNTALLFNLDTNRDHVHRIVGHGQWMCVTFRLSGTFLGPWLRLATGPEAAEVRRLKGLENRQRDFHWPSLSYTLSPSDLLQPLGH
jgi:hypothetical protein